jgi:5-methylcytosine-specific restriction endonuclease McrA
MTPRYRELLFDKRWREKREEILRRDNFKCAICGKSAKDGEVKLTVHHKQYHYNKKKGKHSDPWDYENRYFTTLCDNCHKRGHAKFEVPIKYI